MPYSAFFVNYREDSGHASGGSSGGGKSSPSKSSSTKKSGGSGSGIRSRSGNGRMASKEKEYFGPQNWAKVTDLFNIGALLGRTLPMHF